VQFTRAAQQRFGAANPCVNELSPDAVIVDMESVAKAAGQMDGFAYRELTGLTRFKQRAKAEPGYSDLQHKQPRFLQE
jgi:hypothetical protein